MFGEAGWSATSMRRITARAKVNLAAINYHFGTKEDLAKAVLARAIAPINAERLRRLDELGPDADTRAILRAFVEPPLRGGETNRAGSAGNRLCRVFGRIGAEQPPFLRRFLRQQFREVGQRFESALRSALPRHDRATLWWRLHFVVGAMAHTLQNADTLAMLTDGMCDATDVETLVEQIVAFAAGGMAADRARTRTPRRRTLVP